jgi:hypothetical protein
MKKFKKIKKNEKKRKKRMKKFKNEKNLKNEKNEKKYYFLTPPSPVWIFFLLTLIINKISVCFFYILFFDYFSKVKTLILNFIKKLTLIYLEIFVGSCNLRLGESTQTSYPFFTIQLFHVPLIF